MLSFTATIVYLMFIVGPLTVSTTFLGSELVYEYLLLSGFVAVYLMVGDYFGWRLERSSLVPESTRLELSNAVYYALVVFLLGSILFNAVLHENIPLLDLISNADYADIRAYHAKSSQTFYYASYLINYCNFLVAPLLFYYLVESPRSRHLVVLLPLFILSYVFFLGTLPLVFFTLFVIGLYVSIRLKFHLYRWLIIALVGMTIFSSFNYINAISPERNASSPKLYAIADLYRIDESSGVKALIDNKIYRVMWVPSDVSAVWYRYFVEHAENSGKGYAIKYPNVIGIEYYVSRFSDKYTSDIFAFASFEVDALVRFGWPGFFLTMLAWLLIRLMIARVAMLCGRGLVHSYLLLGTSILLPMASIPAIAFSNGFVVAIILIFLFFDKNKVNFDIALKRLRKQRGADLKAITTSMRKS